MNNPDLVWLVIGFLPATFFLWLAWFTGDNITVKGIILYIFAIIGGPITLALFVFFICMLIDFDKIKIKDSIIRFLNIKLIKGR